MIRDVASRFFVAFLSGMSSPTWDVMVKIKLIDIERLGASYAADA